MEPLSKPLASILKRTQAVITQTIKQRFEVDDQSTVTPVTNKPDQDYQIPSAMKLFNTYKKSKNSFGFGSVKELAAEFAKSLPENDIVESLKANDQGFIFAKIKDNYLEQEINNIIKYGVQMKDEKKQTVAIDFSSPNIAKEMHVGHLRSTILGESISRIFEFLGHDVHRINHLGDWGTQFGMLICHMKEVFPDYLENLPPLKDLNIFYKEAKKKFDENPEFKEKSRLTVVNLQSGDPDCIKAWKVICEISRQEFNKIYKRLDINVKEFGESFYNDMLPGLVKDMEEKGYAKIDDGALCMFIPKKKIPLMLRKSDGGFNYDTTDMAAAKYRLTELKAQRLVYLTDVGQFPHFELIFEAAKIVGWHKPPETRMEHMGFGLVSDKDGQKFKTRSGETVKLVDLLDEAKNRAKAQLQTRMKENKEGQQTMVDEEHLEDSAEKIGMAAIKYFDLRQNRTSNYKFDYDKMLDPKGNTAVYLLYSYARICSIINKSGLKPEDFDKIVEKGGFKITHDHERFLAMSLLRFPEVLNTVTDELNIHKLCDYIYDIAVKISEGYKKYRIADSEEKETRVLLCEAVRRVLLVSFRLIGIEPLERL